MTVIETARLFLRPQTEDDLEPLCTILSDKETMRYYPRPYGRDEVQSWIRRSMRSYEENNYGLWAVILKESNRYIGQCGISLQDIDGERVPEIGYHLNKAYWNNGLATEAAAACLRYGFDVLHLECLYIHTSVRNVSSRRVAEKLGMRKIKEYDKAVGPAHGVIRHVAYAMSAKDRPAP